MIETESADADSSALKPITSKCGAPLVLWAVASSKWPVTAKEVANKINSDTNPVSSQLTRLYRGGYLIREKRENGRRGANPYEYTISTPQNSIDLPINRD